MAYRGPSPIPVVAGGTGSVTLTGVLIGNSTSPVTANALTQYNVLVGGASNAISNIAPGAAATVLTSNGASSNPSFQAASNQSSMVPLSSQTASNSASIAFTSLITGTYNTYKVVYYGIYPVTDATALNLDISTDNGMTYLNTNFLSGYLSNPYNSTTFANVNSTVTMPLVSGVTNSTSNSSICGYAELYNFPAAVDPCVIAQSSYFASGGTLSEAIFTGTNTASTTINAIRFSFSSGNIASGTFVLYGVKES